MTPPVGRHRSGGSRGLVTASILIAVGAGFLAGVGMDRVLLRDAADDAMSASPSAAAPRESATPYATGSPAPPDPAPPGAQGEDAFLAALDDAGLPVAEHEDAIVVLGRGLCQAPPSEQADPRAAGGRIDMVVGDLLTADEAALLAELAVTELC